MTTVQAVQILIATIWLSSLIIVTGLDKIAKAIERKKLA